MLNEFITIAWACSNHDFCLAPPTAGEEARLMVFEALLLVVFIVLGLAVLRLIMLLFQHGSDKGLKLKHTGTFIGWCLLALLLIIISGHLF